MQQEMNSGAHGGAAKAIYELKYYTFWKGPWRQCNIGSLGDLIKKHKPVMVERIR